MKSIEKWLKDPVNNKINLELSKSNEIIDEDSFNYGLDYSIDTLNILYVPFYASKKGIDNKAYTSNAAFSAVQDIINIDGMCIDNEGIRKIKTILNYGIDLIEKELNLNLCKETYFRTL